MRQMEAAGVEPAFRGTRSVSGSSSVQPIPTAKPFHHASKFPRFTHRGVAGRLYQQVKDGIKPSFSLPKLATDRNRTGFQNRAGVEPAFMPLSASHSRSATGSSPRVSSTTARGATTLYANVATVCRDALIISTNTGRVRDRF